MNTKLYVPLLAAGMVIMGVSGAMAKPDQNAARMAPEGPRAERGAVACPGMTPEKQEALKGIMKEYRTAVGPLQDQLKAKRYELDALSRNANTQPEMISKVSTEIGGLLGQIRTVKEKRDDRMESEFGFIPGNRHHKGHNMPECMIGMSDGPRKGDGPGKMRP